MWEFNAAKDKKRKNLTGGVSLFEDDFLIDELDEASDDDTSIP